VFDGTFLPPTEASRMDPGHPPVGEATHREELIHDAREVLRPSQMVQDKLITLLKRGSLPVSYAVLAPGVGSRHRRHNNDVAT